MVHNQVFEREVVNFLKQFETVGVGFEEGPALNDDDGFIQILLVDVSSTLAHCFVFKYFNSDYYIAFELGKVFVFSLIVVPYDAEENCLLEPVD